MDRRADCRPRGRVGTSLCIAVLIVVFDLIGNRKLHIRLGFGDEPSWVQFLFVLSASNLRPGSK